MLPTAFQSSELRSVTSGLKEDDLIFVKLINDCGGPKVPVPSLDPQGDYKPIPVILPIRVYEQVPQAILQRIFIIVVPFMQGLDWEKPRSLTIPNQGV